MGSSPASQGAMGPSSRGLAHCIRCNSPIIGWASVFSGAYIVYPWYRAIPPSGTVDLSAFPQRLLLASAATREWHSFGMEWKEHVAWIAPIAMTMVAYIYGKYGRSVDRHHELRRPALIFLLAAFLASAAAGGFGAFINKYAPVRGGATIDLMPGE